MESVLIAGPYSTALDMPKLRIDAGTLSFDARWEADRAPKTVAAVRALLPLRAMLVQARWSGEAAWVPLGERKIELGFENHTSHPAPGQLLLYPGTLSETEILVPYGATQFGSRVGQLAGNHFATIEDARDALVELGRRVLWEGAQEIVFDEVD